MRRIWPYLWIYLLLIVGSLVFAFPFFWMASTSVKVDRELFTEDIRLKPLAPSATISSPYIDTEYYAQLPGDDARHARLLPELTRMARATGYVLPDGLDADLAWSQIARGIYLKLSKVLPAPVWSGDESKILTAAADLINRELLDEVVRNIHRRFCIGALRVRDQNLNEHTLAADIAPSQRWVNQSPNVVSLVDRQEGGRKYADVAYRFGETSRLVLSQTLKLPFDAKDLQRIQLSIRPDDSWHNMSIVVEMLGRRFVPRRDVPLANFEWQTITWQWPGEDDQSNRIKSWILLDEIPGIASPITDPGELRLTLSVDQASPVAAWWHKIRLNYDRVLDQMPFGRYLRVSLFLVITNIILTLTFSSLIAYAFSRLNWPGRDFCFLLLLATMMIPGQVTMIPHFLIWKSLGAYNTLTPLWLGSAFGNAFFIFLLRQFMKGIPRDLEDAARIDGCGVFRIYWHVILPLVKPSLAAIAIFTFMGSWNDFMGPLLYVADQRYYSLAFGLYAFSVQVLNNPTLTMAGSVLMTVPVIVIFFFAQKYFIQGVTLTGMKG